MEKHSSKIRFVCLMKYSSGMLQKFVIFKDTTTHDFLGHFTMLHYIFPNELPDLSKSHIDQKTFYYLHLIKTKPHISEECNRSSISKCRRASHSNLL